MNNPPEWTQLPQLSAATIGKVLKAARVAAGMDLVEAGVRCGYSASTVSRWETGKRRWSVEDLGGIAALLGVPVHLVGLAESATAASVMPVPTTAPVGNDGPMKRRTLIAASLSAVTGATLGANAAAADGIERALFTPRQVARVGMRSLAGRVASAEQDLNAARLHELDRRLPSLLETAQATWTNAEGATRDRAAGLLSRALAVCGQQQLRLSREPVASVAADRAARYADLAHDPVAAADAARVQATVLRRTGSVVADQVMIAAAERLRADTGLSDAASAGMHAKVLSAAAYTAAGRDDRDLSAECLAAARGGLEPWGDTPYLAQSDLDVFTVSCDRVLGDFGAALHHARHVDLDTVPDAHERGRYWQEVAIAAYGRGRIDLSIDALAELDAAAPQYLRHRSWAVELVDDLLHTRPGGSSPLLHRLAGQAATT
ncbi:helix-turn-helix domain-containing protein [Glycomyces buryatensis]|uniref:Helix-turn-helix transcriptional regulator n=1 Tax=Glycomyces buryatensis TaxID=2570927 RepID=A0A4S8PRM4_9ACTN|nr:helix-turn-helix transcriptional regulator [Glycomyces buryatensis]THV33920.1 helix-turn-helix transcriptional regulator [Glycomyces buryatensis]